MQTDLLLLSGSRFSDQLPYAWLSRLATRDGVSDTPLYRPIHTVSGVLIVAYAHGYFIPVFGTKRAQPANSLVMILF